MAKALLDLLRRHFPDDLLAVHSQVGDDTALVRAEAWHAVAAFLRDDPRAQMSMLVDLTAVDHPDREPRFEVVAHLHSLERGHRLRIKARVGAASGEGAEIASVSDLWAAASWAERECWDMFGVRFVGHPDLRRILLYPEFVGHPLRKDYPAERAQPLVPYREVPDIDKIEPFGSSEGMSFGRQTHAHPAGEDDALIGPPLVDPAAREVR
ncbi:MAG: NADH-quinone oxidoreductase subunit C [Polyangiaceae bacterium]|nr:NADH-quinone oxidoreductase subunit C [Polyangiaceae bacterium]